MWGKLKKRTVSVIALLAVMATALIGFVLTHTQTAIGETANNITDKSRITSSGYYNDEDKDSYEVKATVDFPDDTAYQTYGKVFDVKKDGTGENENEVVLNGLAPYGTAGEAIDLGTYDLSACWPTGSKTASDTPLFSILPQKAWKSTGKSKDVADGLDFTVDLISGDKTINFRFTRSTASEEKEPSVFVGVNGETAMATTSGENIWVGGKTDYTMSHVPFYWDGTPATYAPGAYNTNNNVPAPVKVALCNNDGGASRPTSCLNYARNTGKDNKILVTNSKGEKYWDFDYTGFADLFTQAQLANVKVQVRFDSDVAKDDAYILFTSIGTTDYNPTGYTYSTDDFYKTITLTNGDESVTYSGLVPYGKGAIQLGTYDLSACWRPDGELTASDVPLIGILPQNKWGGEGYGTSFTVDLITPSRTINLRFRNRGDWCENSCIEIGENGGAVKGINYENFDLLTTDDNVFSILPFTLAGKKQGDVLDEKGEIITKPTPIEISLGKGHHSYCNGTEFFLNMVRNSAKFPNAYGRATDSQGNYRYSLNWGFGNKISQADLKNVQVQIRFDGDAISEQDAFVMITSIGNTKFAPEETNYNAGDMFEVTSTDNTIELNKKVVLSDNTALDKLFDIEVLPNRIVSDANYETIKKITATFKGAEKSLDIVLAKFDSTFNVVQFNAGVYATGGSAYTTAEQRGREPLTALNAAYPRDYGYNFAGYADGDSSIIDENGNSIVKKSSNPAKFAIYFDAATGTIYSDMGRSAEGLSTEFGGLKRFPILTLSNSYGGNLTPFAGFGDEKLDVTFKFELASGVKSAFVKINAVDGQDLTRDTEGAYANVYHSYVLDESKVKGGSVIKGEDFTVNVDDIIYDAGILNGFATVDSGITVKYYDGESALVSEGATLETSALEVGTYTGKFTYNGVEFAKSFEVEVTAPAAVKPTFVGSMIKITDDGEQDGIRFVYRLTEAEYNATDFTASGILMIPEDLLSADLTADTADVAEVTFTKDKWVKVDANGNVWTEGDAYYQIVGFLYGIPADSYDRDIATVCYLTIDGANVYSEMGVRSIADVAEATIADPNVPQIIKDKAAKFIVD